MDEPRRPNLAILTACSELTQERFVATKVARVSFLERNVKKRRPTKARTKAGKQIKEPLCVRYAELLRLRKTIQDIQSEKSERDDRPASK